jgi:hypothetical protein
VTALDEADGARGARVEIALRAAEGGDFPTALGILAGLSLEEQNAFGPWITAAARRRTRESKIKTKDRFGTATLIRIDKRSESRDDDEEPPSPPRPAEHPWCEPS